MTVEADIRVRLLADGTVSGLISTRMYPLVLPQDPTLPALTYQRISGPRIHKLTGTTGRARARLEIDSWAETYTEAQSLAAAVRASLDGFIGTLTDGNSPESTRSATIRLDNERDLHEDLGGGSALYRISQDYMINHSE